MALIGVFLLATRVCLAQSPAGIITGIVRDQSGGLIPGAAVEAISRTTGQIRSTTNNDAGEYSLAALLPGEYEIAVQAAGFQRVVRTTTVEAGAVTSGLVLPVGALGTSVAVAAASPQMHTSPRRSAD
jgi:hypothetical protein